MSKTQKIRIIGVVFLLFIFFLIYKNNLKEAPVSTKEQKEIPNTITCDSNKEQSFSLKIDFSGRVNSVNKINILSEVNGVSEVLNARFEVGERFKKGEVLLKIKDDDVNLELKSMKSQFLSLLIKILPDIKMDFPSFGTKLQSYINNFRIEGKMDNLPKFGSIKQRNFLSSRNILSNYYSIKSLEKKIDKFKIRAPFDGIVTKALIDPGSNVIVGQPLGEFINPDIYEISTSVGIQEAGLIKIGDQVVFSSDDLSKNFTASVSRIGSHINELTQSIDLFIVTNDSNLRDGMYTTGYVITDSISNVYALERSQIMDGDKIYLIENDSLKIKSVKIIAYQNDKVIINGISDNDCIVSQPYRNYFYDGMYIK